MTHSPNTQHQNPKSPFPAVDVLPLGTTSTLTNRQRLELYRFRRHLKQHSPSYIPALEIYR